MSYGHLPLCWFAQRIGNLGDSQDPADLAKNDEVGGRSRLAPGHICVERRKGRERAKFGRVGAEHFHIRPRPALVTAKGDFVDAFRRAHDEPGQPDTKLTRPSPAPRPPKSLGYANNRAKARRRGAWPTPGTAMLFLIKRACDTALFLQTLAYPDPEFLN